MKKENLLKMMVFTSLAITLCACSNTGERFIYRFIDSDKVTVLKEQLDYRGVNIVPPLDPQPYSDNNHHYVFNHWDGYINGMVLENDVSFYAVYDETDILYNYRFIDGNTVIKSDTVHYGDIIYAPTNDPIKESDSFYDYTFDGWNNFQEGMKIKESVDFYSSYTRYAKNINALVNSTNQSDVHLGQGNFGTIRFNQNSTVSHIGTGFCDDYYAKLYNDIPLTSSKAIELVSYQRTIDFTIIGSDDYGNSDDNKAHQTLLEGFDVYSGGFYSNSVSSIHPDPLGKARTCEGSSYSTWSQWMECTNIENLTIKNCTFIKYGARISLGTASQHTGNLNSDYGMVNNVTFENCSFINLKIRTVNDDISNSSNAISFLVREQRQKGKFTVKNCTFDNIGYDDANLEVSDTNPSGIRVDGLHNANISNNTFNKMAHNAIGINGAGGITGQVVVENNKISNTLSRAIRLHTSDCALIKNSDASLLISKNTFSNIGLNEEANTFIKASLTDTSYMAPYLFEEGSEHQFELSDNVYYIQGSTTPLTLLELNDGTKNCDTHSGTGEATYLDGCFVNAASIDNVFYL